MSNRVKNAFQVFLSFSFLAAIAALLFELGKEHLALQSRFIRGFDLVVLLLLFIDISVRLLEKNQLVQILRKNILHILLFLVFLFLANWTPPEVLVINSTKIDPETVARALILIRLTLISLKMLSSVIAIRDFFANLSRNPAKVIMFGFAIVIFTGALFLSLPISLKDGKTLSFLDALFTSTSAVCVTGLVVVDTGTHFSSFGQTIILLLIQIGGLGIMTLAVFIGLFLKERLSLEERRTTQNILDQSNATSIYSLIRKIIMITLIIEFIGALCIYISYNATPPPAGAGREAGPFFYSIFHSVSAFCNAGFSLNSNSLTYLAGDLFGNLTFIALIIFGGLGFTVILNLKNRFLSGRRGNFLTRGGPKERITLHTKIVLTMTVALLILGTIFFFLTEQPATLKGKPPGEQLISAAFQSTTTRTAGFNTVDFNALRPATLVIFLALMLIGASPGSTGGGLKTTTFAVMLLTVFSMIREKTDVEAGRRIIPRDTINKALSIIILFIGLIFLASFIITLVEENIPYLKILFEVVSASATVGLSTGITGSLSSVSKTVIIITMFLGRIGPLTLVMAMTLTGKRKKAIRYPEEKIMVG